MNTRSNLRRQLQSIFDQIEFICQHGDWREVIDAINLATDAYALAAGEGCGVELGRLSTAYDALRLVGMLLRQARTKADPMTVAEVAGYLGPCEAKVWALIRNGELTATRSTGRGRPYKISRKSLEDFIDRRTFRPPKNRSRSRPDRKHTFTRRSN
jgi:excisionase family DNA binding protein